MDGTSVNPHQVSRPLDEAVHWDVSVVEVLQHGPPGPCQVVHSVPEERRGRESVSVTFFFFEGRFTCKVSKTEVVIQIYSLLTEVVDCLPVILVDREPLTVSWADVDVHRTKVVVLLVTC